MLRPAGDLHRLDAHLLQLAGENLAQVFDELLALVALAGDAPDDVFVRLRLEVAEGQVLELPLDLPDAEPVGQGRVDVQGLARDLPPLNLGQWVERAHVVEPVGQLDEDDPKVLRHRHHHLADVFGLLLLVRAQRDPAQLGHPVHQPGDLRPELFLDRLLGQRGVLDGVVEEGRGQGRGVQLEVGQDRGDLERVVDVVLAGQPALAVVGRRSPLERLPDHQLARRVEVVGDPEELGNRHLMPGMKFKFGI